MFTPFIISQIFALLGICTDIASWQFKRREYVLGFLVGSALLYGIHFYLLGAHYSAWVTGRVAVRLSMAIFYPRDHLMYVFFVLNFVLFFVLREFTLVAFVALVSATLATIASFRKHDKYLRLW